MDAKICDFLRGRGVPEESIEKMKDDKIDKFVIDAADDEALEKYLPHPGDRLALKHLCKTPSKAASGSTSRRNTVLNSLRKKLMLKRRGENDETSESENEAPSASEPKKQICHLSGNKNAQKTTRKIEIGWLNFDEAVSGYRQVRKKRGGSTRKVDIRKDATKPEILEVAKTLFFPSGKSPLGKMENFKIDLRDFSEENIDSNETVAQMYRRTGMNMLRFYLATDPCSPDPKPDTLVDASDETYPVKVEPVPGLSTETQVIVDLPEVWLDDDTLPDISDLINVSETEVFLNLPQDTSVNIDSTSKESFEIRIHRGPVGFGKVCSYFKDPTILKKHLTFSRIMPSGEQEKAEDTGGVTRDVLSEFWGEFYCRCTVGREVKVPCLRHDFGTEEWKAVGRVLVYGWETAGYWPIQLAKTFVVTCLTDQPQQNIMEDFNRFIAQPDRNIFDEALANFDDADKDDLLDALESHQCKTQVCADNLKPVLLEMAHKELIQTPMFVSDCWRDILKQANLGRSSIDSIYESLQPDNKKVVQLLKSSDQSNEVFKHLKRYVKELDTKTLKQFLRFCTGSDLVTVDSINVTLSPMRGLQRRPIGHTCGCVLEVGDSYDSFMEFRTEFDAVLHSNIWVMDII